MRATAQRRCLYKHRLWHSGTRNQTHCHLLRQGMADRPHAAFVSMLHCTIQKKAGSPVRINRKNICLHFGFNRDTILFWIEHLVSSLIIDRATLNLLAPSMRKASDISVSKNYVGQYIRFGVACNIIFQLKNVNVWMLTGKCLDSNKTLFYPENMC